MELHFGFVRGTGTYVESGAGEVLTTRLSAVYVVAEVDGKTIVCPCRTYEMQGVTLTVNAKEIKRRRKKCDDDAYILMSGGTESLYIKATALGSQFLGPHIKMISDEAAGWKYDLPYIRASISLGGVENSFVVASFGHVIAPFREAYDEAVNGLYTIKDAAEYKTQAAKVKKALEEGLAMRKRIDDYTVEDYLAGKELA